MHHPTLFAKRAEKQGSLDWLTPHSTSGVASPKILGGQNV